MRWCILTLFTSGDTPMCDRTIDPAKHFAMHVIPRKHFFSSPFSSSSEAFEFWAGTSSRSFRNYEMFSSAGSIVNDSRINDYIDVCHSSSSPYWRGHIRIYCVYFHQHTLHASLPLCTQHVWSRVQHSQTLTEINNRIQPFLFYNRLSLSKTEDCFNSVHDPLTSTSTKERFLEDFLKILKPKLQNF